MNILIIGGGTGIGRELALLYASEKHSVTIAGRRLECLEETASQSPNIKTLVWDINEHSVSQDHLDNCFAGERNLDLVILSSGTGHLNDELDYRLEEETLLTNVVGFTFIVDQVYSQFRKQSYGHLACITSIAGLRGSRSAPAYNASKAYQINYLEGLRQKASRDDGHIIVTDIRPGSVNTDMMKGEGHFWIASPLKAAMQIKQAINLRKPICYITRRWRLIAWLLKLMPEFLYRKL